MQAVYFLVAIVCNVGVGCVEYAFDNATPYEERRDCLDAIREAERDNRGKPGMENVEFDCKRELIRK